MLSYIIHSYNYIVLNLQSFDGILMVQENLNGFFLGRVKRGGMGHGVEWDIKISKHLSVMIENR